MVAWPSNPATDPIPDKLRTSAEYADDGDRYDRDIAVERAIVDLVRELIDAAEK